MATTLCSVHIFGASPEDVAASLKKGDVLRTLNAPWLSVLPGAGEDDAGYTRMKKLAKRSGRKALVFFCFDDDEYELSIYEGSKRTGGFNSRMEMFASKAKKASLALRGDLSLEKPLTLLRKCGGLEEQIELLEELLGAALYDMPEAEARRVEPGDAVSRRVIAREKALRNRPNQYSLTPLSQEEWPASFARSLRLAEALRSLAAPYQLPNLGSTVLHNNNWLMPGSGAAAEIFDQFRPERSQAVVLIDERTGVRRKIPAKGESLAGVYWVTKDSLPVCGFRNHLPVEKLVCLNPGGGVRWQFAPKLMDDVGLRVCHVSEGGVITAFTSAGTRQVETRVWRIDGETGRVLFEHVVSPERILLHLVWMEAVNAFAGYALGTNELVILDGALNEARAVALGPDPVRLDLGDYDGPYILKHDFVRDALIRYDLRDDSMNAIHLELSDCSFHMLLPDNALCTVRLTNAMPLCIFDAQGRLISRNSVKGGTINVFREGADCYVVSGDSAHAFDGEIRLWRLEKKA